MGTKIIEPGYTRRCTRNSQLKLIESAVLDLAKTAKNLTATKPQKKKSRLCGQLLFSQRSWCRRPDSNRHVFLRLILNQLRLPISPLRHGRDAENVAIIPVRARHASSALAPSC